MYPIGIKEGTKKVPLVAPTIAPRAPRTEKIVEIQMELKVNQIAGDLIIIKNILMRGQHRMRMNHSSNSIFYLS